jgi:hypothetical protein
MDGEYTLNAYAGGDAAYSEAGGRALAIVQPDNHALKDLDSFPLTLSNSEVYVDGIASAKSRNFGVGGFFQ